MGNNTSTDKYYQYYQQQQQQPARNIQRPSPHQVFQLQKNFTLPELKDAYKKLIVVVHPDKGGTDELFQYVTECFRALYDEWKLRAESKTHAELKEESSRFVHDAPPPPPPQQSQMKGDKFSHWFNKTFDENKLEDEERDTGYGEMMVPSSKVREDIDIQKKLSKFDQSKFNETFNKQVTVSKAVVHYEDPEPLVLTKKLQFVEIGGKTKDFSDGGTHAKRNIQYADYLRAHTTQRLVDENQVKTRKDFRTVEEYEQYSAQIAQEKLTAEEIALQEKRKEEEERQEQERLERMRIRDQQIAAHHQKLNMYMIGRR